MGNDEVSKNPQALAEAQAYRDRKASDPPPKPQQTMMFDGRAAAKQEYDAHAAKGLMSFEEMWKNLDHGEAGVVVGMLTEEEYRKFVRVSVWHYNGKMMERLAEAEMNKARVIVSGMFMEIRERVKIAEDSHLHVDLKSGALHECKAGTGDTKDLARMLLAKLVGG